jgi:GDPmannose 4,6-dehydratase
MKKVLITGITGQDGSYLTEYLLSKGYEVHGIRRRSSSFNTWRIDKIWENEQHRNVDLFLHDGDMTDVGSLYSVINKIIPDEIYNLAAQSHVGSSFLTPNYTSQVNAIGTLNLFEAVREAGLGNFARIYQASTSEMFGISPAPQSEKTPFRPISPYAISKLYAYEIVKLYRNSYNFFASNGILFNHESSRRGGTFVTQKIIRGLIEFKKSSSPIVLGNIYAKRDWGHARDFVEGMWKILQLENPVDLVLSTNTQYSVKDFIELCAKKLQIELNWIGQGMGEKALDSNGKLVIVISKEYYRPLDVDNLCGDSNRAKEIIDWNPRFTLSDTIDEMILNHNNL